MVKKSQSRLFYRILIGIVLILILGIYFVIANFPTTERDEILKEDILNSTLNSISIPVSSGYYTGEFTYELSGNESKWVSEVKFSGRDVIIIPKEKIEDRSYKECIDYDKEKELCLKEEDKIYSIPEIMPVKVSDEKLTDISKKRDSKTLKESFNYKIPDDVHYLKIGENSITITELQATTQSNLVNVTAETGQSNFTHLTINSESANAPYDSLVGYWNFDADAVNTVSFTSYDWSKNNNDGTARVTSTVDSTGCVYGNCLQPQNLSNSGILLPANSFNITGNLSISAWFSPYTESGRNAIFSRGAIQTVNAYALVLDYTNNYLQFIVSNGSASSGVKTAQVAEGNFSLYVWHHAVGTWNGTIASLYVDGVLIHQSTPATFTTLNPANLATYIGRQGSSNTRGFNGTLDEIMVFNTSLTAVQVLAIYNNQSARFYSTGTQDVPKINVSSLGTENRVNITLYDCDALFNSNLSGQIGIFNVDIWDVSSAIYLQKISVATKEILPTGVFFKPDGTKMYTIGIDGVTVDEYDLSTAWNVSTAVYLEEISVNAKETSPRGVFFRADGLKMYTVGSDGDSVDEYDLSTAWNVSSAIYLEEISVATKETAPQDVFFKPDGTKMYTMGDNGDTVDEYDLSTAWNVSTAVYLEEISVNAKETIPQGVFFRADGLKMYTIGVAGRSVDEYDLSTAWNVSTAVYLQEISVITEETSPQGVFFKPDGTKMYIIGVDGIAVDEYELGQYNYNGSIVNFSSCIANNLTIAGNPNHVSLRIGFLAGTNQFYSPIVIGNITLDNWYESPAGGLDCGDLNIANNIYNLTNDLTSSTTCFNIFADNITIDCKGYTINYSTDINNYGYGVYSLNYDNIVIKNCKILEANSGNLSVRQSAGVYFYVGNNITLTNNTIITLGNYSDDILFIDITNSSIINNNLITSEFNAYGYSGTNTGVAIVNNNITTYGLNGHGIVNSPSGYNNISYNNLKMYNTEYSNGIYLIDNINIFNDINYNNITGGGYSILFYNNSNTNVLGNIIISSGDYNYGIFLYQDSNNNTFSNNTITTSGILSYGVLLQLNSDNNSFSGMNIATNNTGAYSFYIASANPNIIITNSIFNSSLTSELRISNLVFKGLFNLTNVTRADGSRINIIWTAGGNGTLNMMWYLDVNVSNSTSLLENANVTSWDVNNNLINSSLTGSNGQTRHILQEYKNENNTLITYYSNYTINTNLSGYNIDSQSINMSMNRWLNIALTLIAGDTCSYTSGNWAVNCADYCNITTNVNGGGTGNNFTVIGVGWFKMSANISGFKNYKFGGGCNATCTNTGCIRI